MAKNDLVKEKLLLEKAQKNKANFTQLYEYFLNDVYRFSFSVCGNQHDAEDITSQTFLEMFNKLETFEWREISLKYWLFQTAHNLCLKNFNKNKKTFIPENIDFFDEKEESFEKDIINKDELEFIKLEINKLNPNEKELINLRIWEELSFEEIAKILSEKSITVRQRFYRSMEKLKVAFASQNYNHGFVSVTGVFGLVEHAKIFYNINPANIENLSKIIGASSSALIATTSIGSSFFATIKTFIATNVSKVILFFTTLLFATAGTTYLVYENYKRNYTSEITQAKYKDYIDEKIGISFKYPENYEVQIKGEEYGIGYYTIAPKEYFSSKAANGFNNEYYILKIIQYDLKFEMDAQLKLVGKSNTADELCKLEYIKNKRILNVKSLVKLPKGQQLALMDYGFGNLEYVVYKENSSKDIIVNQCEFEWANGRDEAWSVEIESPQIPQGFDEKRVDQLDYIVSTISQINKK